MGTCSGSHQRGSSTPTKVISVVCAHLPGSRQLVKNNDVISSNEPKMARLLSFSSDGEHSLSSGGSSNPQRWKRTVERWPHTCERLMSIIESYNSCQGIASSNHWPQPPRPEESCTFESDTAAHHLRFQLQFSTVL